MAAGDGVWFFYAKEFLSNSKVYSDLHLIQQPFFILYNALGLKLFGDTYFAQKIIFIPLVAFHCYLLYLLVIKRSLNTFLSSIIYLAIFFIGIHFEAYRFDDYHFMANTFILFQMLILFDYFISPKKVSLRKISLLAAVSTLCMLTRINDGLIFYILAILSIFFLADVEYKKKQLITFLITTSVVFCALLVVIRETPFAWLESTIFHAMSSKGGASLFLTPFLLIEHSASFLFFDHILIWFFLLLGVFFYHYYFRRFLSISFIGLSFVIFSLYEIITYFQVDHIDPISDFTAFSIIFLFLFWTLYFLSKLLTVFKKDMEDKVQSKTALIFIPSTIAFISGGMSSGGYHFGLYFPAAIFLLSITQLDGFIKTDLKVIFYLYLGMLVFYGATFRFNNPYSWHSYYSSNPFLNEREVKFVKGLGFIYVDKKLDAFVSPVCKSIRSSKETLLSLPFPFANYYCDIPVWHGYVQTFFDTTSNQKIDGLILDLDKKPPSYIFYQQQLDNLRRHEIIFNHGNPLRHRFLDQYIMKKIKNGEWKVLYLSDFGAGNKWYLIKTDSEI